MEDEVATLDGDKTAEVAEQKQNKGKIDFNKPLWKSMFFFFLPLMVSNILNSISSTISSIILGRMVGVTALAAISAFFPILFFLISFVIGVGAGSSVLIGQAFGAQEWEKVKVIVGTTLSSTFLIGLIVAIPGYLFTYDLLKLTGTPADVIDMSAGFARIIFVAIPFVFLFNVYTTFFRGSGDSNTPFYFLVVSTVLNILLTPALVIGWGFFPAMGVNGAALANVIAMLVAFAAFLIYLKIVNHPLQFDGETARNLRINWPILKLLVGIGIPTSIQMILVSLSAIAVISFINKFGSTATAAFGAVNQVISYVQMPAASLGITISIFGAQAIGAGYNKLLNKIIRTGILMNYLIVGVIVIVAYIFGRSLLSLFLTEAFALELAFSMLVITLWSYPILGNNNILAGIMRSSGTVFWPTLITVSSIWLVQVPVAYVLHTRLGVQGVMFGFPAGFIAALIFLYLYYHIFWKGKEHARLV